MNMIKKGHPEVHQDLIDTFRLIFNHGYSNGEKYVKHIRIESFKKSIQ